MDIKFCVLLIFLSYFNITHSVHVSGTITENATFFYRKLPVVPSVRATIEFSITYSQSSMRYRYPLMGIYTTYPKLNIKKGCSYIRNGQLYNENLHPHLRVGRYRTTTCELSGADTVNCRGGVTVQDYIPRNFHLTFGFHCDWLRSNSLQGLEYNISFTDQSNDTNTCTDYSILRHAELCTKFYSETSVPNLIGGEHVDKIVSLFKQSITLKALIFPVTICYQYFWEVFCHVMLPKCDPFTKQVMHPCREMCWDLLNACWPKLRHLYSIELPFQKHGLDYMSSLNKSKLVNCDYLPSLHGSIPCFYKPVTCDSPPDVTNGTRILNITKKDVYQLQDVVQYACVNDTLEMRGNASITCLYSGQWSQTPPNCVPVNKFGTYVYFLLPIIFVLLLVIFVFVGFKYKRKSSPELKEEKTQLDCILAQLTDNDESL